MDKLVDTSKFTAPLRVHKFEVEPGWIDMNDHMNVAYFVMMFDLGVDGFQSFVDLGPGYLSEYNMSTFAVQYQINHTGEMLVGEKGYVNSQLIGFDHKLIHLFKTMHRASDDEQVATMELILLNVDTIARKAVPMPADRLDKLARLAEAHAHMPRPALLGRQLGIPDRPAN